MYKIFKLLIILFIPSFTNVASSPLYGGDKHHYDKSAVEPQFRPKQVQLATGTAECVRTAWIGDINNRTLICTEWRMVKKGSK